MIPSSRTAALPPQPLPFLGCCCATGCLAPAFGLAGAGFPAAGLAAAGLAVAGFGAGFGAAGFAAGAGAGVGGAAFDRCADIVSTSITRVLPPLFTAAESSVRS